MPHKISGLEYEFLYNEHHSLYCGRGHPLFDRAQDEIPAVEVRTLPISSRGYWRERQLRQMGFEQVEAIVYNIEPQLNLIMSGSYLGFLPDHFARTREESGDIRRVRCELGSYTCAFEIFTRRGGQATELSLTFITDLRTCYRTAAEGTGSGLGWMAQSV